MEGLESEGARRSAADAAAGALIEEERGAGEEAEAAAADGFEKSLLSFFLFISIKKEIRT